MTIHGTLIRLSALILKREPQTSAFQCCGIYSCLRVLYCAQTASHFFLIATQSRSKLRAIQIAWKRLIGSLWVPLFINQSGYCVLLPFLHRNLVISGLNHLMNFCMEFTKNCISLSQSDSRIFLMYITTVKIALTVLAGGTDHAKWANSRPLTSYSSQFKIVTEGIK